MLYQEINKDSMKMLKNKLMTNYKVYKPKTLIYNNK